MRRVRRITRDTVLLVCGLAGVAYETLAHQLERPALLMLFGGMMGLTKVLRKDEAKQPVPPDTHPPVLQSTSEGGT